MESRSWLARHCQLELSGLLIIVGLIVGEADNPTFAQVTADPSLGTQVTPQVTPDGTTLEIKGGTTVGDRNLFHSFSNFNVKNEEVVDFRNASTINNILVRVTGGNPSNIQGILKAQGNANLFLINPQGIVFGENARLDIGGSFTRNNSKPNPVSQWWRILYDFTRQSAKPLADGESFCIFI